MKLSEEIVKVEFTRGFRGYSTSEVDDFLEYLIERVSELEKENERLMSGAKSVSVPDAPDTSPSEDECANVEPDIETEQTADGESKKAETENEDRGNELDHELEMMLSDPMMLDDGEDAPDDIEKVSNGISADSGGSEYIEWLFTERDGTELGADGIEDTEDDAFEAGSEAAVEPQIFSELESDVKSGPENSGDESDTKSESGDVESEADTTISKSASKNDEAETNDKSDFENGETEVNGEGEPDIATAADTTVPKTEYQKKVYHIKLKKRPQASQTDEDKSEEDADLTPHEYDEYNYFFGNSDRKK